MVKFVRRRRVQWGNPEERVRGWVCRGHMGDMQGWGPGRLLWVDFMRRWYLS